MRLWPRNLIGQLILAVALTLFIAQAINVALLMRGQRQQALLPFVHSFAKGWLVGKARFNRATLACIERAQYILSGLCMQVVWRLWLLGFAAHCMHSRSARSPR